jgi:Hypoxia induced protein conserved region
LLRLRTPLLVARAPNEDPYEGGRAGTLQVSGCIIVFDLEHCPGNVGCQFDCPANSHFRHCTDLYHSATLKGGILGGLGGLVVAGGLVVFAHRRYHFFNQLTPQLKAFLITSGGTFTGIIAADHSSRAYETQRNPLDRQYAEREKQRLAEEISGMSWTQRAMDFGRKERYKIVGGSWLASMIAAFAIVNRNKYLTGPQKLVQARVYAQFLTLGVLVASAAFEISDSKNDEGKLWETVRVIDPNDPEHKRIIEKREHKEEWQGQELWRDMVDAEEQRMKERERGEKKLQHEREKKKGKSSNGGKDKD